MRNFIIILSLFCFLSVHGKPKKTCAGRLSSLSARENLFTQCVLKSFIPTATYCTSCQNEFKDIKVIYKEFLEGSDSVTTQKCKDVYKDDLHIINYMFNYSQQLWNEMACSECLVNQNVTKLFLKDCDDFHDCVQKAKNDSCTKCNSFYNKIIAAYNHIKGENPKRICGQILENVHHVKTIWAKNLGCNQKHKSSLILFTAISSVLMILPGLFYGGLYTYRKHVDEDETESNTGSNSLENGKRSDQVSPSVEPGTSKSNKKDDKECDDNIDALSDISTDSGEELLLDLNPNKQEVLKLARDLKMPPKEELIPTRLMKFDSSDDEPVIPTLTATGPAKILL